MKAKKYASICKWRERDDEEETMDNTWVVVGKHVDGDLFVTFLPSSLKDREETWEHVLSIYNRANVIGIAELKSLYILSPLISHDWKTAKAEDI